MRNETRGAVFKKQQFITVCYSTCVRIEMKQEGQFSKNNNLLHVCSIQQFITVCYSTCVRIEMKQDGQFSKKNKKNSNLLQYAIQLVCILEWNKRGSFQKNPIDDNMLLNSCAKWNKRGSFQKTTIYYCMLFNLCAYWNETRGTVLKKKKNTNLLQYAIQLVCILKWNKRGSFQKTTIYYSMLFNLCAYWNETRGTVFQKNPIYDNMLLNLCAKWNKRGSFQKQYAKKQQFITVCYSTCAYWNETRGTVFKKKTIYYSMLFNLCAYWNETRGTVFKKIQLMTICCLTREGNETQFSKKQRGSFQKTTIYYIMLFNKRGSFQKTTIYYSMLFNLCAYWNETRGTVFKKKHQFITVCYSTCVHIEMKQDGQFSKKSN